MGERETGRLTSHEVMLLQSTSPELFLQLVLSRQSRQLTMLEQSVLPSWSFPADIELVLSVDPMLLWVLPIVLLALGKRGEGGGVLLDGGVFLQVDLFIY